MGDSWGEIKKQILNIRELSSSQKWGKKKKTGRRNVERKVTSMGKKKQDRQRGWEGGGEALNPDPSEDKKEGDRERRTMKSGRVK